MRDEINLRVEWQSVNEQHLAQEHAERETDRGAHHADDRTLIEESTEQGAVARAHRLEHGDFFFLIEHDHDQRGNHGESGNNDNQRKHQAHQELLDTQGGEETVVQPSIDVARDLAGLFDVIHLHLDTSDAVARIVEGLRLVQVRVHELRIVLVETSVENTCDAELFGNRRTHRTTVVGEADGGTRDLDAVAELDL